ncbi:unnamed protein product [Effrenium voratum]|uniref:Uncharacterized protein n=1 Tax=Effrenium voratum TaxID=2562239 RepID=A0AA36HYU9_9DINO|nr:unnamed protein product [Effrenium voratum]
MVDSEGQSPMRKRAISTASVADSQKDLSPARRLMTGSREVSREMKKPRKLAALGIFGACVASLVWHQVQERQRTHDLLTAFDVGKDEHLSSKELASLLQANGVDVSQDQVGKIFGRVDDEGDGFDDVELMRILTIVSGLPAVSERIQLLAASGSSWIFDLILCSVAGVGLYYIVGQSDVLEKRWLQSSFRGAVQFHRMQSKCSKLNDQLENLSAERVKLEDSIREIEASSPTTAAESSEELTRLSSRLQEVVEQQRSATDQLQAEVSKWQATAEEAMQQSNNVKSKMAGMMTCIKGLDAFSGSGMNKFDKHGAQQGFSHKSNVGFCLDTITFGTIDKGKLLLFETSTKKKIGEGRDCAYRCKELETGEEFALKMYTMSNPSQRRAIMHDLYAHKLQIGKHPRIVSYERVIESETTIFVLMELLAGKDLFDIMVSRGRALAEDQARPLFAQLVEGLQHLHSHDVIHCDVKPENAMVLGNIDAGAAHLKLIDFGCSCFNEFVQEGETRACVVHDRYMPPELSASPSLVPSVATDMWRTGCTLFVMLTGFPPFPDDAQTSHGREAREQGRFYKAGPYEPLSDNAKDLLEKLLAGDPGKRPETSEDDIRRAERELLESVKKVFEQELDLIQIDDTIRYWADRPCSSSCASATARVRTATAIPGTELGIRSFLEKQKAAMSRRRDHRDTSRRGRERGRERSRSRRKRSRSPRRRRRERSGSKADRSPGRRPASGNATTRTVTARSLSRPRSRPRRLQDAPALEKSLEEAPLIFFGKRGPIAMANGPASQWIQVVSDEHRRSFVSYRSGAFREAQLQEWFDRLRSDLRWDKPEVKGRPLPRSACWLTADGCSCTYRYSGTQWPNMIMPPWFLDLTDEVCRACGVTTRPNSCNANLYEDGSESVGWHADDEPCFDAKRCDALIISLSLGATRTFVLRPNDDQMSQTRLALANGDLCTMEGLFQKHYMHAVLQERHSRSARINLTWRWVVKHDRECIRRRDRASAPIKLHRQVSEREAAAKSAAAKSAIAKSAAAAVQSQAMQLAAASAESAKLARSLAARSGPVNAIGHAMERAAHGWPGAVPEPQEERSAKRPRFEDGVGGRLGERSAPNALDPDFADKARAAPAPVPPQSEGPGARERRRPERPERRPEASATHLQEPPVERRADRPRRDPAEASRAARTRRDVPAAREEPTERAASDPLAHAGSKPALNRRGRRQSDVPRAGQGDQLQDSREGGVEREKQESVRPAAVSIDEEIFEKARALKLMAPAPARDERGSSSKAEPKRREVEAPPIASATGALPRHGESSSWKARDAHSRGNAQDSEREALGSDDRRGRESAPKPDSSAGVTLLGERERLNRHVVLRSRSRSPKERDRCARREDPAISKPQDHHEVRHDREVRRKDHPSAPMRHRQVSEKEAFAQAAAKSAAKPDAKSDANKSHAAAQARAAGPNASLQAGEAGEGERRRVESRPERRPETPAIPEIERRPRARDSGSARSREATAPQRGREASDDAHAINKLVLKPRGPKQDANAPRAGRSDPLGSNPAASRKEADKREGGRSQAMDDEIIEKARALKLVVPPPATRDERGSTSRAESTRHRAAEPPIVASSTGALPRHGESNSWKARDAHSRGNAQDSEREAGSADRWRGRESQPDAAPGVTLLGERERSHRHVVLKSRSRDPQGHARYEWREEPVNAKPRDLHEDSRRGAGRCYSSQMAPR